MRVAFGYAMTHSSACPLKRASTRQRHCIRASSPHFSQVLQTFPNAYFWQEGKEYSSVGLNTKSTDLHLKIIDSQDITCDAREFLRETGLLILMFHEHPGAVSDVLKITGTIRDVYFVLSFSWHIADAKAIELAAYFNDLEREFPSEASNLRNNIVLSMNSIGEANRMRVLLPEYRVTHVNNTCFLSERQYRILKCQQNYNAVMNAKPLLFKRHYLASSLSKLLLLSYADAACRTGVDYFNLERLCFAEIQRDVSEEDVPNFLNQSCCGLALSELEGACYASTEYLLCGIPVVSTISLGGRDDYYNSDNTIIAAPDATEVKSAVDIWASRMISNAVDRAAIRDRAIAVSTQNRMRLCDEIAKATSIPNLHMRQVMDARIADSNKLWAYKNFWTKRVVAL